MRSSGKLLLSLSLVQTPTIYITYNKFCSNTASINIPTPRSTTSQEVARQNFHKPVGWLNFNIDEEFFEDGEDAFNE